MGQTTHTHQRPTFQAEYVYKNMTQDKTFETRQLQGANFKPFKQDRSEQ